MTPTETHQQLLTRLINNIKHVDAGYETACWEWQGSNSGTKGRGYGYGRVSVHGHTSATHRVMWVMFNGYLPPKKQIDHLCNNRICCNPDHLEMVTHLQNQRRKVSETKR